MSEMSNARIATGFAKPDHSAPGLTSPGWRALPVPRGGGAGSLLSALAERARGPGGYYNLGNVLGLAVGVAVQVAGPPQGAAAGTGLWAYFAGSPSAFAMSVATAIFIASGECYHRAFQGEAPNQRLYRIADLLSGAGALALGAALFALGHPVLAATAGALHAAGKLGSAAFPTVPQAWTLWPSRWPDPFRSTVVASRIPAMIASAADLWAAIGTAVAGGSPLAAATPATLLVCYLLWTRADLLLIEQDLARFDAAPTSEGSAPAAR